MNNELLVLCENYRVGSGDMFNVCGIFNNKEKALQAYERQLKVNHANVSGDKEKFESDRKRLEQTSPDGMPQIEMTNIYGDSFYLWFEKVNLNEFDTDKARIYLSGEVY